VWAGKQVLLGMLAQQVWMERLGLCVGEELG